MLKKKLALKKLDDRSKLDGVFKPSGKFHTLEMAVRKSSTVYNTRWEDVYNVDESGHVWKFGGNSKFATWDYYMTYGGGPTGGYVTNGVNTFAVHYDIDSGWTSKPVRGQIQFDKGDRRDGIPPRVRFIRDKKTNKKSEWQTLTGI